MPSTRSISILLKLRQNRIPLFIVLGYLIFGLIYFLIAHPNENFTKLILYILGADTPENQSAFEKIYSIIWSVVIAQAILGFIISTFLQEYNPVATSKFLAKAQRDHTLIIHYDHFAQRIAEFLKSKKRPFVVIEDDQELVEDLINEGLPVVIGDSTQLINLENAKIKYCKEVFIASDSPQETITVAKKIRNLDPTLPIYARVFDDNLAVYLTKSPINALTFSTSQIALLELEKYCKNEQGPVVIMGLTNLALRLIDYFDQKLHRKIYFLDQDVEPGCIENSNVTVYKLNCTHFKIIKEKIPLEQISQLFICWKDVKYFETSFTILSYFTAKWPKIKCFVRVFNYEMREIIESFNAIPFSSSAGAFEFLRQKVQKNSGILD